MPLTIHSIEPRETYTATAGQDEFDIPFFFFENGHIFVTQNDTLLVQGVQYTVTGAETEGGGLVTLITPAELDDEIVVYRVTPQERLTDYSNSGDFTPDNLDTDFVRLLLMIQELGTTLINLGITLSEADLQSLLDAIAAGGAANSWHNQLFEGDGVETEFTLASEPGNTSVMQVHVSGVRQTPEVDYQVNGTLLTFTVAPPAPAFAGDNIVVVWGDAINLNIVPSDGTVREETIVTRAVTSQKIALEAILTEHLSAEVLALFSGAQVGEVKVSLNPTAPDGWIVANDGTIGNAASSATTRANADTEDLFTLLWDTYPDAFCPVSGGRGASAADDFAANKRIQTGILAGRVLGASGSGAGLSARAAGDVVGAEEHTLVDAEMPAHQHFLANTDTVNDGAPVIAANTYIPRTSTAGTESEYILRGSATAATVGLSSESGSDDPHNNMQPTTFLKVYLKL